MRIVGEDRLSRDGPRSGDDPLVRGPVTDADQGADLILDVCAARMRSVEPGQRRDRRVRLHGRKHPACLFRGELLAEMGAQRLELIVLRQLKRHQLAPDDGVGGLPGLRTVAADQEFGRQRVLVTVEEGVDAICVGLQPLLRLRRQGREAGFRLAIEPERAHQLVDAQEIGAGNFGHAPLPDPSLHFHLEEPLTGVQVTERTRRIVHRRGEDVRNAVGVPPDADLRRQTRQLLGSGSGRHGAIEEVGAREGRHDDERDDEPQQSLDEPPDHTPPPVVASGPQ